jgi:hypothetical protein
MRERTRYDRFGKIIIKTVILVKIVVKYLRVGDTMLGLLVNDKEIKELEYILKREMEELLHDLGDSRIDRVVKHAMEERYQLLFKLFTRFAPSKECSKYFRNKK